MFREMRLSFPKQHFQFKYTERGYKLNFLVR
jgi:hypothetical protein